MQSVQGPNLVVAMPNKSEVPTRSRSKRGLMQKDAQEHKRKYAKERNPDLPFLAV